MQQDVDRPETRQREPDATVRPKRFGRAAFVTLAIVAAFLGALAWFQLSFKPAMIKGFLTSMVPPPVTISTEQAKVVQWTSRLPSVGSLVAIQGIDVTSQVAGVVASINFESGQDVVAGAKLVTLDSSVEQADLANNKASLQQAELDLARQNDLSRRAIASEATQQAAQAKRDSAAAAVQKTQALIAQKTIVAPFNGRIGIRKVDLGQYIAPGTLMSTIQALDPIRVDFPVPEQELSKVKIGQPVEITVGTFPDQVFKGKIQSLDARVSLDTRALLIRALLENPDKKLLPGMFANVSVLEESPRPLVTVPRTAITYSLFGDSVYVVKPAAPPAQPSTAQSSGAKPPDATDVAERRFVRVGETREDRVAILEGVAEGEQVVTSGQLKLQNGARVKVDNSAPLTPQTVRPKL